MTGEAKLMFISKNTKKYLSALLAALLVFCFAAADKSFAYEFSQSSGYDYTYNLAGRSVASPQYFRLDSRMDFGLTQPTDLFVIEQDLYIMDGVNNRYLIIDIQSGKVKSSNEIVQDGEKPLDIKDAAGIFVTKERMLYITLYEQRKIAVVNPEGRIVQVIDQPKDDTVPENFEYKPKRIVVHSDELLYVVADGSYQGIVQMDLNGKFLSFFGSNKVSATIKTLLTAFWRKIFSDAQRDRLQKSLPTDYSSIALGKDGFLYSSTSNTLGSLYELKRHSPAGNNITIMHNSLYVPGVTLSTGDFGDMEKYVESANGVDTSFIDLAIDEDNRVYGLDITRGRVFQYDSESNLLGCFGSKGLNRDSFTEPVAIDVYGTDVYVLDKKLGAVFKFEPTGYADNLMMAAALNQKGLYKEAQPYWQKVRTENTNLPIVAKGLGRAELVDGNYVRAMAYFKEAADRRGYNEALLARRNILVKDNFIWIFIVMLLIIFASFSMMSRSIKSKAFDPSEAGRKSVTPFDAMLHPTITFDAIKENAMGNSIWAVAAVLMVFLVRALQIQYTGFLFASNVFGTFNAPKEFIQIAVIFTAWVTVNWAVGTLIDGEGKAMEIFHSSAYSLLPFCLFSLVSIALSHMLTLREGAFVSGISLFGLYWSIALMILSIGKINRYSLKKTALSILLSILGILFILFLFVMMYTLVGQLVDFVSSIYYEILFRM